MLYPTIVWYPLHSSAVGKRYSVVMETPDGKIYRRDHVLPEGMIDPVRICREVQNSFNRFVRMIESHTLTPLDPKEIV